VRPGELRPYCPESCRGGDGTAAVGWLVTTFCKPAILYFIQTTSASVGEERAKPCLQKLGFGLITTRQYTPAYSETRERECAHRSNAELDECEDQSTSNFETHVRLSQDSCTSIRPCPNSFAPLSRTCESQTLSLDDRLRNGCQKFLHLAEVGRFDQMVIEPGVLRTQFIRFLPVAGQGDQHDIND
jgi:hypothetical protein